MQSRKNHDKASKTAKEGDTQLPGPSVLTSQTKVNSTEKTKQTSGKSSSKSQSSKASPRRKPVSRTDDLKHAQNAGHRHQSPSPSRGSSQASSSPISAASYGGSEAHSAAAASKFDDGAAAAAAVSLSPINSAPSYSRSHLPHVRKLSGRSRHSDLQGKSKVTIRHKDDGKIYIRRSSEDRNIDPERLIIDRCNLKIFPIIENEEQLRLLNLQHNQISRIENLHLITNLIFLDLSDNIVEHITCLEPLLSLRVLILARNRIRVIGGLDTLTHLDFLDLSGNEIKEISNLNHLQELRVLNLSSNQLAQISNLKGLESLIEINLCKNSLSDLSEVNMLPRLQRLFLAQNYFERFEDISLLLNIMSLSELTLEGCPITLRPNYRYLIMYRLPQLKFLDMRRVLDEEKRTAHLLMRKEEMKRQEGLRQAKIKETKEKAITTACQLWEALCKEPKSSAVQREQLPSIPSPPSSAVPLQLLATRSIQSFSEEEEDPSCSCCGGQANNCDQCDGGRPRMISARVRQKSKKTKQRTPKKGREPLRSSKKQKSVAPLELEVADTRLSYLAEADGEQLRLYGPGAVVAAIGNMWTTEAVNGIKNVRFQYIIFDSIAHLLGKVKTQFPNVVSAAFECTCLDSLSQLNALGQISGLETLTIGSEGNSILQLSLWRLYAVYRLGPAIANINDTTVTQLERVRAEDIFGGLGLAASSLLPKYRLSSLLNSPRVKQIFLKEKGYSPNSLQRPPDSQLASDVVKVAFTYNPDFECVQTGYKSHAKRILEKSQSRADEAMRKRLVFQRLWPSMFLDIVNDSLEDYIDLNRHMKLSMLSLLKKCKTSSDDNNNE